MKYPLPVDMSRCHGHDCDQKEVCQRFKTMPMDNPGWLYSYVMTLRGEKNECDKFIDFYKN